MARDGELDIWNDEQDIIEMEWEEIFERDSHD